MFVGLATPPQLETLCGGMQKDYDKGIEDIEEGIENIEEAFEDI